MNKNKTQTNKENAKDIIRKRFEGEVLSNKSDKTIVVKVDRVRIHPKYQKRYTMSTKYQVHDEKGVYNEGDKVSFVECRPLSKNKRWRVLYN
jgi:small subunit ribosomal protein S17